MTTSVQHPIGRAGFWAGLLGAGLLLWPTVSASAPDFLRIAAGQPQLNAMAAVGLLMAIWWITEAAPLAATSLLPLVLFPVLGILETDKTAAVYGDTNIFLYLGGFLVALAIEESGLHERLALAVIGAVGGSPQRLVGGFMLSTAFLSMWLSNTATTLMMLPIAGSVLHRLDRCRDQDAPEVGRRRHRNMGVCLMLGIAYAASIGGIGTLIGSPTNTYLRGFFEKSLPDQPPLGFLEWMLLATPFAFAFLGIAWAVLVYVIFPMPPLGEIRAAIAEERTRLGPMRTIEKVAAGVFLTTALLWICRKPLDGWGWYLLFPDPENGPASKSSMDAAVAIGMAIVCFLLPTGRKPGERLLTWEAAKRIPWDVLLLFGGGLALARGLGATGLDVHLGHGLAALMQGMSPLGMAFATAAGMTFFTEITSNQAAVQMLCPLLAGAALELGINPRCLLIPATISASCAFMLPVATPPNAIVYGSGRVKMADMVQAGFVLNWIGVGVVVGFVYLYGLTAPVSPGGKVAATAASSAAAGTPASPK